MHAANYTYLMFLDLVNKEKNGKSAKNMYLQMSDGVDYFKSALNNIAKTKFGLKKGIKPTEKQLDKSILELMNYDIWGEKLNVKKMYDDYK